MKTLLIATILLSVTSCALKPKYQGFTEPQKPTTLERIERCTYRLIEQNGIKASESQETCNKIFRRNQ